MIMKLFCKLAKENYKIVLSWDNILKYNLKYKSLPIGMQSLPFIKQIINSSNSKKTKE